MCISLLINGVEYLLMYFLPSYVFEFLAHFFGGKGIISFLVNFKSSVYTVDTILYKYLFCKILPVCGLPFHFITFYFYLHFEEQNIF